MNEKRKTPAEISLETIEHETERADVNDPETRARLEHDFDIKIPEDAAVQSQIPAGKLLFDGQNCYMLVKLNNKPDETGIGD